MRLWYDRPAEEWVEALPLGNGRIGAMLFSNPDKDIIMLNEDTLWSGYPRDTNVADAARYFPRALKLIEENKYKEAEEFIEDHMLGQYTQAYMPLGDLEFDFPAINREGVTEYYRELNLDTAIVTTSFLHKGVRYKREAFISHPDQCMVIRFSADKAQSISFSASFDSQLKFNTSTEGNTIFLDGICPSHAEPNYRGSDNPIVYEEEDQKKGIRFRAAAIIENDGGKVFARDHSIQVDGAHSVIIKLCIRTSFNGYDKQPYLEGKDYIRDCHNDYKRIQGQLFDNLKACHIEDYQELYNRVVLDLDADNQDDIPTDRRLELFQENQNDKGLYELIFQYGRYLLIASSREGTQPANLQGIWNKELLHVPFGIVSLGGEKLATRKGKVVLLEDILSEAIKKTLKIIEEKNPGMDEAEKEEIARQMGVGAVVFSDLSNNRIKDVSFSWDEILNFDGETGPYVQYTHARTCSLLKRAEMDVDPNFDAGLLTTREEFRVIKTLYLFPDIVVSAMEDLEPSIITRYLVDLAQDFNRFYHEHSILVEDQALKNARLALVLAVNHTLANGLSLIGLSAPERV